MKTKKVLTCTNGEMVAVNKETGEIVETDGKKLTITELGNENIVLHKGIKHFMKINVDIMPKLIRELTNPEMGFLFSLIPHISYVDCALRKNGHRNNKLLTAKDIAEVTNMDYAYVRKHLSNLNKKGVIGKHSVGSIDKDYDGKKMSCYTVNPYIFFRGNAVSKFVLDAYKHSGWK